MSENPDSPGLHGKLPSHGDFITRRLSRGFVEEWDGWLQRAIAASRAALGEGWLDIYLTSPIWCFALQAKVCGGRGWAGILMPSVDRVGRYFPLTLAVPLANATPASAVAAAGWFESARNLALSSLEQEGFSLDAFDAAVAGLGALQIGETEAASAFPWRDRTARQGLCLPMDAERGPQDSLLALVHGLLESQFGGYSLWWSEGSAQVAPSLLLASGLPAPEAFTAMLDGQFRPDYWLLNTQGGSPGAAERLLV